MVDIGNILSDLAGKGNLRRLVNAAHCGPDMVIGGRRMLNLSSNDYLGLASDAEFYADFLRDSGMEKLILDMTESRSGSLMQGYNVSGVRNRKSFGIPEQFLFSSSSSRLLTGNFSVYDAVENELCALYGTEAALVFGSGYHANSGILPAVTGPDDIILADKLVHASIIDGIRLSAAKTVRYRHQDMDQLESLLRRHRDACGKIFIVTESIFSMDGDVTDLARLAALKREYGNVMLYVDEAHAVGVRGSTGLGVAQEQGCIADIDFLIGTLGKALASAGGYVVCTMAVKDFLVNRMRTFIFTTALPPVNMLWTLHVLKRLPGMSDRRARLAALSERLRSGLSESGYDTVSRSQIVPLVAGDSRKAVMMAGEFQRNGFYLLPVRPPTVPEGTSRLRISLTASVTDDDVDRLLALLSKI